MGPALHLGDGLARSVRPPARRNGRGSLFSVQDRRRGRLGEGRGGPRLHVRSGLRHRGGRRLLRQLRKSVVRGRAFCPLGGTDHRGRRMACLPPVQHEHPKAGRRRTARRRRTGRGHGRSGAARSQRNGRTGRAHLPRPGRQPHRRTPADREGSRVHHCRWGDIRGQPRRRHPARRHRSECCDRTQGHRIAGGDRRERACDGHDRAAAPQRRSADGSV